LPAEAHAKAQSSQSGKRKTDKWRIEKWSDTHLRYQDPLGSPISFYTFASFAPWRETFADDAPKRPDPESTLLQRHWCVGWPKDVNLIEV
jgi:hypothetical protein